MEIHLPTLAELEAWWIAHPTMDAVQEDSEACLIGVPLQEQYPDYSISVEPSRVDYATHEIVAGIVKVSSDFIEHEEIPLPEELNALAKEFDLLPPHEDIDVDNGETDEWNIRTAAECVELIHDFRERIGQ